MRIANRASTSASHSSTWLANLLPYINRIGRNLQPSVTSSLCCNTRCLPTGLTSSYRRPPKCSPSSTSICLSSRLRFLKASFPERRLTRSKRNSRPNASAKRRKRRKPHLRKLASKRREPPPKSAWLPIHQEKPLSAPSKLKQNTPTQLFKLFKTTFDRPRSLKPRESLSTA